MDGLRIANLKKSYLLVSGEKINVLNGINLELLPGQVISLVGESGCGKSTLAHLILGLDGSDEGEILLNGEKINNISRKNFKKYRKNLQGVFQDATGALNPAMSVENNLQEGLRNLTNYSSRKRKETVYELMTQLHISNKLLENKVKQLSGGEQRRISLIRALALRPDYLVLDEVVSGLDAVNCRAVLDTLMDYQQKYQCSYLFITHDMNSAYKISDKIYYMEDGKLKKVAYRKEKIS